MMRFDGFLRRLTIALVAALVALALAAQVAAAVTAEQFLRVHSPADARPAAEVTVDPGFSWAAAGVGAGTAALLILASVALLAYTGREHLHPAR